MTSDDDVTRILFLCSANACRSQMAEGFARARQQGGLEILSAGTRPTRVHPLAIKVMAEAGVDLSAYRSKSLDDFDTLNFDVVITLCSQAAEGCPVLPGNPELVKWNLPDPDAARGSEETVLAAFRNSRDEIRRLVDDFFERGYLSALVEAKRCADMILNNISDGIIAHDLNRRIFYFNHAAEKITGYSRDEVINRDCHDVFPGRFCGGKCHFCNDVLPRPGVHRQELEIATKSGEQRDVEMTISSMHDESNRQIGVLVAFRDLTRERRLARRLREIEQFSGIIGRDDRMLDVFELIRDLADVNVPVLIQGETGTGKELVAAAIHNEGQRANNLFVPVNCGALPEALLESELFGHVKGAFTGAIRDKKGRFELADGGTIFLDEVGDISPAMQVKLLRVLQEGTFERVGSEKSIKVSVRVISATNKDLAREIEEGRFRNDLYYRLSVVPVNLPPLRERRNDIPLLAENVLERTKKEMGKLHVTLSHEALDLMMSYEWPGNVRELQNWLQFALVKCKDNEIRPVHFPPGHHDIGAAPPRRERRRRRKLDIQAVRAALREAKDNKVKAAGLLGVSRATLYRFLDDQGL